MRKSAAIILFLLAGLCVAGAAEDFLSQRVSLHGEFTFSGIIKDAERQLGIEIRVPRKPDDLTRQSYNQSVTLEQFIHAVEQFYARDAVELDWSFVNKRLNFVIVESKKTASAAVEKMETNRPSPPPVILAQPESRSLSRPEWAGGPATRPERVEPAAIPPAQQAVPVIARDRVRAPEDLDDSFPVSIPKPATATPPQTFWTPPPKAAAESQLLRVTPYPENAKGFINDAPPLVQSSGSEVYVEWETRMKGAIQQGNSKLLQREKLELEKRLQWLRQNMP